MGHEKTFDGRAANYSGGRPGYAPAAVAFIFEQLLPEGGVMADIGAGTGIFTKEALQRGVEVYAVEPNGGMMEQAKAALGEAAGLHYISATAEQTTLPAHSMDLVVAASAFHWFDAAAFRAECRRILKPGGKVCLLINARDYADPFTQKQHALCEAYCHGFSSLAHGLKKIDARVPAFFAAGWQRKSYSFPLEYTRESFVMRSLSSSYAPDPDTEGYAAYTAALHRLLDEAGAAERITVPNATVLFWGEV